MKDRPTNLGIKAPSWSLNISHTHSSFFKRNIPVCISELGVKEVLSNIMVDKVDNNITETVPAGNEDLVELDLPWHYADDLKAILGSLLLTSNSITYVFFSY